MFMSFNAQIQTFQNALRKRSAKRAPDQRVFSVGEGHFLIYIFISGINCGGHSLRAKFERMEVAINGILKTWISFFTRMIL